MGCCNARNDANFKEKSIALLESIPIPLGNNESKDETKPVDFKFFFKSSNDPIPSNGTSLNIFTKNGNKSDKLLEEKTKNDENTMDKTKDNTDNFKDSNDKNFEKDKQKEAFKDNSTSYQKIKYPILDIRVFNNKTNQSMDVIKLTPNSIISSQGCLVKQKMGEKFSFGRSSQGIANKNKNDYNFNDLSIGLHQFDISFKDEKFYVVDNKKGSGLFVKIPEKIAVDHDMIVSFCSSHMILQVENDKEKLAAIPSDSIRIRFLQGSNQKAEKCFNPKERTQVRIGRSKDAEIVYKDESVSRIQCTLSFEGGQWILYDGHLENGGSKSSTNGLWLLANQKVELKGNMLLKTGNTTLSVRLIKSASEEVEE